MFLYTVDRSCINSILGLLPVYQVFRMYRVSVRVSVAVHHYVRTTWTLDTFLDRWFGPDSSEDVMDKLDECGAIISGSTVLQFLSRLPPNPESDLDIFVPLTGLLEFGRWLQRTGYTYRPRGTSPMTFFDVAALTVPARWSAGKHAPVTFDPLSFVQPFEVFDFVDETERRLDRTRSERLQLVVILGDPRKHILTFHSTVVMNYISGSKAVSIFPISTVDAQVSWVCRGPPSVGGAVYGAHPSWREKYKARGYSVVDGYGPEMTPEPNELKLQRSIGDTYTWTIDFERAPVFARRGGLSDPVKERDKVAFEIITTSRGPVTSGCYMNISPPFTTSFVDESTFAITGTFAYLDTWPYGGTFETIAAFGV
uniref:Protein kinase domain-containing protein n=1 Tax=Ganoderma boninense TaxID=34458 RepID=A0A5K1K4W1_9APHY|nr:Protein kinase domain-containing protein [Ganoderma boninense]